MYVYAYVCVYLLNNYFKSTHKCMCFKCPIYKVTQDNIIYKEA